jgi:hypothetical protein
MDVLAKLETKLNDLLVKQVPPLPEGVRKWLATYAWVFALIGAVLGVMGCIALLGLTLFATAVTTTLGGVYGTSVATYVFFAWLALLVLVVNVVLLAMAVSKLKRMQKSGWNLLFYSELLYFVYGVFNALYTPSATAIFSIVWNAFITAVSLYFLFQVRSYFTKAASAKVAGTQVAQKS